MPSNCGPGEDAESPLDSKEIEPANLKGNQPWIFTGRTDAEAEAPVFWSSDANSQLFGKVPDAGQDWEQEEKRVSEDEMAWRHHQCDEHECRQTPGDGEAQGGLACCSPWGHKELDTTGCLNNNTADSQYCVSFRYTTQWFSYTLIGMYVRIYVTYMYG